MGRGFRNNNPLNIINGGNTLQGEKLPPRDAAFKEFDTMAYGYRAAIVNLATYIAEGCNTLEKIIARWAPECENDTEAYTKSVVSRTKIARTKVITHEDGELIIKIVAAMSFMENGVPAVASDVEDGFKLQTRICRK